MGILSSSTDMMISAPCFNLRKPIFLRWMLFQPMRAELCIVFFLIFRTWIRCISSACTKSRVSRSGVFVANDDHIHIVIKGSIPCKYARNMYRRGLKKFSGWDFYVWLFWLHTYVEYTMVSLISVNDTVSVYFCNYCRRRVLVRAR